MRFMIVVTALMSSVWAFDVKQLDVMVLPDYLFPGVAVEFNGEISPEKANVALGLMVSQDVDSVVVVKNVETPSAIAERPDFEMRGQERWIVANLGPGKFRIIFFYTPFVQKAERGFEYIFKADKNIESAHLGVQKPIAGENFSIQLEGAEKSTDQHGSEVYNSHIHDYRAMTEKRTRVTYVNPTGSTTLEALRAMLDQNSSAPQTRQQPPPRNERPVPVRHKLPTWEPLAALAIVAVVVYYFYKNQPVVTKKQNKSATKRAYCSSCGKKVNDKAKFCSSCGEKI